VVGANQSALAEIQQNSTHLFQRPDQDHVSFDPTRRQMAGWAVNLTGEKRSGASRFALGSNVESPGFDLNDAGLLFSGDDIETFAEASYTDSKPGDRLHQWSTSAGAHEQWNFGGIRESALFHSGASLRTSGFWSLGGSVVVNTPGLDDAATRGGPLIQTGWGGSANMNASTPSTSLTQLNASGTVMQHQTGTEGLSASASLTARPVDRLQVSVGPRYVRTRNNRQYLDTLPNGPANTFGMRYLFASVDRRELAVRTRGLLSFDPDLTLELYVEPFASAGAFDRFGDLPRPRAREMRIYGQDAGTITRGATGYTATVDGQMVAFDDPNFTVLSLRSTAVLRWEFAPGSTLFAVWQQGRSELRDFAARIGHEFADSFRSPSQQVFALKLSYWLPI